MLAGIVIGGALFTLTTGYSSPSPSYSGLLPADPVLQLGILVVAGFAMGVGARTAGGCTSGRRSTLSTPCSRRAGIIPGGAKKLLRILERHDPRQTWPARMTVCDLLKRHDLVPHTRGRPRLSHPGRPLTPMTEPNGIWTADFKGQFKTRDGVYCYPLTLVDGYSRYLLACQGLRSTAIVLARPIFRRAFEEYGLPRIIRSDNGVPFATTALGRLSLPRKEETPAACATPGFVLRYD